MKRYHTRILQTSTEKSVHKKSTRVVGTSAWISSRTSLKTQSRIAPRISITMRIESTRTRSMSATISSGRDIAYMLTQIGFISCLGQGTNGMVNSAKRKNTRGREIHSPRHLIDLRSTATSSTLTPERCIQGRRRRKFWTKSRKPNVFHSNRSLSGRLKMGVPAANIITAKRKILACHFRRDPRTDVKDLQTVEIVYAATSNHPIARTKKRTATSSSGRLSPSMLAQNGIGKVVVPLEIVTFDKSTSVISTSKLISSRISLMTQPKNALSIAITTWIDSTMRKRTKPPAAAGAPAQTCTRRTAPSAAWVRAETVASEGEESEFRRLSPARGAAPATPFSSNLRSSNSLSMFQSKRPSHSGDEEGAHTPGGEQEGGEDERLFTCSSAMNDATCGISESKQVAIRKTTGWWKEANIDCRPSEKTESMCDAVPMSANTAPR
ncbi:unnamed protein product [Prorocentrum cordatum]|uniref:G-patch domain-containing protein n=1 Tax=Prorocentrum cordatum TaxID=2364126 RepID=A0ABN9X5B0_9DINO|nr:unnamed protein product [Polarella glacialis]